MTMPTPPQILALDALFQRALASMDLARDSKRALDRELREITGYPYDDVRWDPSCRDLVEREVRNLAGIVARIAADRLSRRGARLDIDLDEHLSSYREAERAIRDRCRRDHGISVDQMMGEIEAVWRAFSPLAFWQLLADVHSPESVSAQAFHRAARCLAETFELARRPQPRVVGGRIELEIAIRAERQCQRLSLRYETQRLHALAEAFETFALACYPDQPSELPGVGHALARTSCVGMRERIALGGGVDAVVFLTSIKLYLPPDVAAHLNQFVTMHAASAFAPRGRAA